MTASARSDGEATRVARALRRASRHAGVFGLLAVVMAFSLTADGPLTGDDHYSLWAAQSLWAGDLPNRDFHDPGSPLQTLLSYAGQLATRHRPIGEILISVAFRTLGILCVYFLSLRAAGQRGIAWLIAALVAVMSLPEGIYSSDKLLLYPLTALVAWRYLDGRQSVAPLALLTAAAFLLRHDHVLYVGAPLLLAIVAASRSPVPFVVMTIGLLLPWMAWVQWHEGLVTYVTTRVGFAGALGLGTRRVGFGLADGSLLSHENAQRLMWPLALITTATAALLAARARERRLLPLAFTAILLEVGILLGFGSYPAAPQIAAVWLPLGGWLASRARRPITVTLAAAFAIVVMVIVAAATGATDLVPRLAFDGGGLRQRITNAFRVQSTLPPIDIYAPPGAWDDRLVVRYVHDCLDPDDRVWETSDWFSLPYQSERAVVEHPYWSLGFRRERDAAFAESLPNRPMPPLIVVRDVRDPLQAFRHYPVTQALVDHEYAPITSARFEQFRADVVDVQLLTYRGRAATGVFAPLDLPCFRREP